MITSTENSQVKNIRLLMEKASARKKQRLYVVEGVRMFLEAPDAMIEKVYISEGFEKKGSHMDRIKKLHFEVLSDKVFKKLSDTHTPQGLLLVMKMPEQRMMDIEDHRMYLILNRIQDPGNLGTMIRTAEAAGAAGVIMDSECADIFNPKTIRSTMGSIFRVPFQVSEDLPGTVDELKEKGVSVIAADLKGEEFYEMPQVTGSYGIMIGNEGSGLSDELCEKSDIRLRIPMSGKVNSLNAAISASLLMYQARFKQSI